MQTKSKSSKELKLGMELTEIKNLIYKTVLAHVQKITQLYKTHKTPSYFRISALFPHHSKSQYLCVSSFFKVSTHMLSHTCTHSRHLLATEPRATSVWQQYKAHMTMNLNVRIPISTSRCWPEVSFFSFRLFF